MILMLMIMRIKVHSQVSYSILIGHFLVASRDMLDETLNRDFTWP